MHDDTDIRRALADLPDPPLPGGLRAKVEAARARRARRLRGGIAGTLAVAVLTAGVVPWLQAPVQAPAADVVANGSSGSIPADAVEDLRAIDRALQAAYARGASDDEIAPLWQARHQLSPPVSGT